MSGRMCGVVLGALPFTEAPSLEPGSTPRSGDSSIPALHFTILLIARIWTLPGFMSTRTGSF